MAVNEGTRRIVGGVDTHKDLHVAAVVDEQDRVIETRSFATTRQGSQSWSRSFEQDSAKVEWTAARVGPLQFRARGVTEGWRSPTGDTSCARRKIHAAAARGDGVK